MTGFICVNKSKGVSSAKEVAAIKRLTGTPCGHMGTLDPMADGVLPVAIGNAARLFDYMLDKRKNTPQNSVSASTATRSTPRA